MMEETIWAHGPLISLDTETGGLDPEQHDLLTLAVVRFVPGVAGYRSLTLTIARDAYRVTPRAMEVNGLDLAEVTREGQTLLSADMTLALWLGGLDQTSVRLLGQNLPFDLGFVRVQMPRSWAVLNRLGLTRRTLDTRMLAEVLRDTGHLPRDAKIGLTDLAAHYGIEYHAHEALSDAVTTARVYSRMVAALSPQVAP